MKVERDNLESLKPSHNYGVFLEDRVHDWDIDYKINLLHFYSRVVKQGENVKILIDYEDMKCVDCLNYSIGDLISIFVELQVRAKEAIQSVINLRRMYLIMELYMISKRNAVFKYIEYKM